MRGLAASIDVHSVCWKTEIDGVEMIVTMAGVPRDLAEKVHEEVPELARRSCRLTHAMGVREATMGMQRVFLFSFGVIAALLVCSNVAGMWRAHQTHLDVHQTWENAISSVELVSRIGRDVDRERLLIDTHIAQKERVGMEPIERRFAQVQQDLDASADAYRPLVIFPHEREVWEALEADYRVVRPAIGEAFELSRQDRDAEAREKVRLLDDRFSRIDADVTALIQINRSAAGARLEKGDRMLDATTAVSAVLAGIGVLLTIGVGVAASRLVHHRERLMVNHSRQLEAQNRELDAFASRVAHDLRSPLTIMNVAGSRLMEPNVDAAATGALVRRATSRMEMLIRDLLALSQVERLSRDAVCDPASVMATIYDELAERAQAKTGTLRATVDPARVLCNEGLLLQVLSNLSDNALKYARPEVPPTIDINGRSDGRWYELRIADNGVGMSEDEAREAFTPFYRAMRLRGAPGTGLGLSIVKRVAEASGGSVVVESKLGVGTTFVLRLRIADGSTVET